VSPVELDSISEDLEVVFDFVRGGAAGTEEDEAAGDEEDDGGDVEVVGGVSKACEEVGQRQLWSRYQASRRTLLRLRNEPTQPSNLRGILNNALEPDASTLPQLRPSPDSSSRRANEEVVEGVVGGVEEERRVEDGEE
jgi:hypothetical protein